MSCNEPPGILTREECPFPHNYSACVGRKISVMDIKIFLIGLTLATFGQCNEQENADLHAVDKRGVAHEGYESSGYDSYAGGSGYAGGYAGDVAAAPAGVAVPIAQHVEVSKPVPVPIIKHVGIPIPHPVPVAVPHPVPVAVPQPYPVHVTVPQPIAVPVYKAVPVPVEKPVPYPVEKPYPVHIEKHVPVPVPKPYPVKVAVPVYKHIYHSGHHH